MSLHPVKRLAGRELAEATAVQMQYRPEPDGTPDRLPLEPGPAPIGHLRLAGVRSYTFTAAMTTRRRLRRAPLLSVLAAVIALAAVAPASVAAAGPETAVSTAGTPARVAFNGSRKNPVVALTFDDGANAANTRRVFEILQAEKVPATFFPYAYKVRADPDLWREITQAGYPIGHHSLSHADLTEVSEPRLYYEIRQAQRIIEQVTARPMLRVLRPTYGARDERLARVAGELGYPTLLLWDVESRDTSRSATVSGIYERATRGRNGSVVLMHAGPTITTKVLRAIIANYRGRGFTFVTIPELLGAKRAPWPAPPAGTATLAGAGVPDGGASSEPGRDAGALPAIPRPIPARSTPRTEPVGS